MKFSKQAQPLLSTPDHSLQCIIVLYLSAYDQRVPSTRATLKAARARNSVRRMLRWREAGNDPLNGQSQYSVLVRGVILHLSNRTIIKGYRWVS